MSVETNSEGWNYPCSDDEISKSGVDSNYLEVDPAELENLYDKIEKNEILNLEWRCPGRRNPSPVPTTKENQPQVPVSQTVQEEKSDFDFMEEISSLRLRVRKDGEDTLRGSAKKKTTSFDGIMSNIMRHKRMEQMEREANMDPATSSPS